MSHLAWMNENFYTEQCLASIFFLKLHLCEYPACTATWINYIMLQYKNIVYWLQFLIHAVIPFSLCDDVHRSTLFSILFYNFCLFYAVLFIVQSFSIYFSEVLLLKSEKSRGFYIMLPWHFEFSRLFIFDVRFRGFGEPLNMHCEPI